MRNSSLLETLTRGGFVGYGLLHLAVGWIALQIAFGHATQEGSQSGVFQLLAHQPLGRPLLVVIAVGLLAMAVWQALEAAVGHHDETGRRRLADRVFSAARRRAGAPGRMTYSTRRHAAGLGRVGYMAKGLAFGIAGLLAFAAGVKKDAARSTGLDGALHTLAGKPYGQLLLVAVAAGFAAIGVCCFFQSRYRKV